jgi:hypothetical protein
MQLAESVNRIVEGLGELEPTAREQIAAIVGVLGENTSLELLDQTLRIEADGGMMVSDGSRRRTPGGVFFHLARRWLPPHERRRIFYSQPTAAARGEAANDVSAVKAAPAQEEPARETAAANVEQAPLRPRRRIVSIVRPIEKPESEPPPPGIDIISAPEPRRAPATLPSSRPPPPMPRSEEPDEPRLVRVPRNARAAIIRRQPEEPAHDIVTRDTVVADVDLEDFQERVRELAEDLARDLVPLLRQAIVESVRGALRGQPVEARMRAEPTVAAPRASTVSANAQRASAPAVAAPRERSKRAADGVRGRALSLIAGRPGISAAELAVLLYGDDGTQSRAKVRSLLWKLEQAGTVQKSDAGRYQSAPEGR